jgi:hypothetical protein
MTAQVQLDLLEWADAGDAVLRNVGQFGPAYDHAKVERFQKATNAVEGVTVAGATVSRVRVDGLWGREVVRALQILLGFRQGDPVPAVYPNVYRYQQWNNGATQSSILLRLADFRQAVPALFPAPAAPPDPRVAAASEAQAAAEAAATEPLTAPPAPEPAGIQPPPDEAAPGPRPPSPRDPLPPPPPGGARLSTREGSKSTGGVPWLGIGLGVLAVAGVIGWAVYRQRKRGRA